MQQAQQQLPAQQDACARHIHKTGGRRLWHARTVKAECASLQGLPICNSQQAGMQLGAQLQQPQGYATTTQPVQLATLMQSPVLPGSTLADRWGLACAGAACLPLRPQSPSPDVVARLPTLHSRPSHRDHSSADISAQPRHHTVNSSVGPAEPRAEPHSNSSHVGGTTGTDGGQAVRAEAAANDQPPSYTTLPRLATHNDRQARALMTAIKSCADWQSLRALLTVEHRQFNMRHITALVHHCSSLVSRYSMSAGERIQFQQWLTQWVLPTCEDLHLPMRPRELSTVLHALASMQYVPPPRWVSTYCGRLTQLVHHSSLRDMASTLWSLSKLLSIITDAEQGRAAAESEYKLQLGGLNAAASRQQGVAAAAQGDAQGVGAAQMHRSGLLLQAAEPLAQHMLARSMTLLHIGNGQDLANIVLSASHLHKLAVRPPSIPLQQAYQQHHTATAAVCREQQGRTMGGSSEPDTRMILHVNGTAQKAADGGLQAMHHTEDAWQMWLNAVLTKSIDGLASCNGQALANIALGISKLPVPVSQLHLAPRWRAAYVAAAVPQLSNCSAQALTAMVTTALPLGWAAGSGWAMQLQQVTQGVLRECSIDDLCDMGLAVPALMSTGHRRASCEADVDQRAWWRAFEDALVQRLHHASPKHYALLLSSLANAHSQLGISPSHSTIHRWFDAAEANLHQFSSLDVSQSLAACVTLSVAPPAPFMQAVVQSVRRSMRQLPMAHISSILTSLARLRYNPGWQFYLEMYNACIATSSPFNTHISNQASQLQTDSVSLNGKQSALSEGSSSNSQGLSALGHQPSSSKAHLQQQQLACMSQMQLQELSMLVSALASLHQRPMACWVEWLVAVLPAAVSTAQTQLQSGSRCQQTAQCFASMMVGLLRLHIIPPPALLLQLVDVAVAAAPYLPAVRCALLLWATVRLTENATSSLSGLQRSRKRRTRLLALNQRQLHAIRLAAVKQSAGATRLAPAPVVNGSAAVGINGHVSSVLSSMLEPSQHARNGTSYASTQLARADSKDSSRPQVCSKRRGTAIYKPGTSLQRLRVGARQANAQSRQVHRWNWDTVRPDATASVTPPSIMSQLQQPMARLLQHVLESSRENLYRLPHKHLGTMLYALLPAIRVLPSSAGTSKHWAYWHTAWLMAHTAYVQGLAAAQPSIGGVAPQQQAQKLQQFQLRKAQAIRSLFISASRINRLMQGTGLQPAASITPCSQPVGAAHSPDQDAGAVQAALQAWLQAVMQAATGAGLVWPLAQLPALVELANQCGLQPSVASCVQHSLLTAQPALLQEMQAGHITPEKQKQRPRRGQPPPLEQPVLRVRTVEVLQLAQAVVSCGVHRQGAAAAGSRDAALGISVDGQQDRAIAMQQQELNLQQACRTLAACLEHIVQEQRMRPQHKVLAMSLAQQLAISG